MPSFRFRRFDIVMYGAVLVMAALIALFVIAPWRGAGATDEMLYGVLTVDGQEVWRADLDSVEEQEYTLVLADGSLTVRVGNGQAQVTVSDCPDQVCVRTGAITYEGQAVVCLPHRAVLSIRSDQTAIPSDNTSASTTSASSGIDVDVIVR